MLINLLGYKRDQIICKNYKNKDRFQNMRKETNFIAIACLLTLILHSVTVKALSPDLLRNKTSDSTDYIKLKNLRNDSDQHIFTSEGTLSLEI